MTIDYRDIVFSPDLPAELIKAIEGAPLLRPDVINGNDHTITFGYGYTFVRGPNPYVHLVADLDLLGIVLTQEQLVLLQNIATNRQQQLDLPAAQRNWTLTDNLI